MSLKNILIQEFIKASKEIPEYFAFMESMLKNTSNKKIEAEATINLYDKLSYYVNILELAQLDFPEIKKEIKFQELSDYLKKYQAGLRKAFIESLSQENN